jgi:hypothetical protein
MEMGRNFRITLIHFCFFRPDLQQVITSTST